MVFFITDTDINTRNNTYNWIIFNVYYHSHLVNDYLAIYYQMVDLFLVDLYLQFKPYFI